MNRDRNKEIAARGQGPTGATETGIFDPGRISRVQENTRRKVNGLLGTTQHNHLIRNALNAPCHSEVVCNRFAERSVPRGLAIAKQAARRTSPSPSDKPCPDFEWKSI